MSNTWSLDTLKYADFNWNILVPCSPKIFACITLRTLPCVWYFLLNPNLPPSCHVCVWLLRSPPPPSMLQHKLIIVLAFSHVMSSCSYVWLYCRFTTSLKFLIFFLHAMMDKLSYRRSSIKNKSKSLKVAKHFVWQWQYHTHCHQAPWQ